jgi:hypothetical protein
LAGFCPKTAENHISQVSWFDSIRYRGGVMMKLNVALWSAAVVGAMASQAQAQQVPDYYVGAGVRAGFNDDTSFVIDSKAKVVELGDRTTLSVRPSLVFDNSTELRLPISVDYALDQALYPYAGAGVA